MNGALQTVRRRWLYITGWVIAFIPLSFLVRVHGRKNILLYDRAVIIANHTTFTDPYILTSLFPLKHHVKWIAKSSLRSSKKLYDEEIITEQQNRKQRMMLFRVMNKFLYKFFTFFAYQVGTIIVDKEQSTTQRVISIFDTKNPAIVGIFPTGARHSVEPNARPRSGFVVMAREAVVPVIPIAFYRVSLLRWHMKVFPPISPTDLHTDKHGTTDNHRAKNIMNIINNHLEVV